MATQILGKVGMVLKGEYNNLTSYQKLDVVTYNGQSYVAKGDTTGNLPTDTTYWQLLVKKPVRGTDYWTNQDKAEVENDVITDITPILNNKADKSEIPDVSNFITKDVNNLTNYELKANTGASIALSIDNSTYIMTISLKNSAGTILNTQTVDLPLETMVVSGSYDNINKKIVLTLKNGNTIDVPVGDLISGLQTEITSSNKLSSDLVDDTNNTNKFVTLGEKETWNNKGTYSKPSGGIPKTDLDSSVQTSLEEIENLDTRVTELEKKTRRVYGIRRKISNNTSPTWERIESSVGLVANATKDGSIVQNDFDNLYPWKEIISFNLDLATGRKTAYYGDADFKFDGSNGDVYTHIPTFWIKIYQEDGYIYILIADYAKSGFTEIKEFDIQRYLTGIGQDGKLHSYSGIAGADFRSIVTYRNLARNLGNDYCLMDWRYFAIQYLYLVEYATFYSQSALGNGISSLRHDTNDAALVAETNTNRFIVNTTAGNAFIVGQQVKIGTYENSSCVLRTITAINEYSENGITGKEIVLDEPVANITLTTTIWSGVQSAGQCDALGMKSGCLLNDNKHNVIYRGIEGIFGNIFMFVDGINIKDRVAYICYNPENYVSDKFTSPYEQLGYTNASSNGYAKTLGFDANHPLIQLPTEIGAGDTTGTTDYYYQNTGNRVARVGGYLGNGTYCGLWYWGLGNTSSDAAWSFGARVLKYQ